MEEQTETQDTEEPKEAEETGGEMINITKMEEIWSQSSMAMPQRNSQPVGPGEPNTAKDQDLEGPALTPSSLILTVLRAGRRRRPCRRGSCMSLQALRKSQRRRTLPKPKNQEFTRDKAKAGTSNRTTHADFEALDGRYGANSNLADKVRKEPGRQKAA